MKRRLHLALLLVAFFCVCWFELPDALAPLVFAIPLFVLSVFSRTGVHMVDFASFIGAIGVVTAIGAFIRPDGVKLLLWTKVGLAVSATLFVAASRPWNYAAFTSVPFALLAIWPSRNKRPNSESSASRLP